MFDEKTAADSLDEDGPPTDDPVPGPLRNDSGWKALLTASLAAAIEEIESSPELEEEISGDTEDWEDPSDLPDLYTFYEALAVLRNEYRAGNRKTADALGQLSESLQAFDRQLRDLRAARQSETAAQSELPRSHCLALIEFNDRVLRIADAMKSPPPSPLFGAGKWPGAWSHVAAAIDILVTHVESLLRTSGLQRIDVAGKPFDPATMNAVSAVPPGGGTPSGAVARQIAAGYLYRGDILRLAEVEIAK